MRALAMVVVGFAAACGGGSDPDSTDDGPDATTRNFDGFDVLVSGTDIQAWAHFLDDPGPRPKLAPPGECAPGSSDAMSVLQSCLDHLAVNGTPLHGEAEGHGGVANPFYLFRTTIPTTSVFQAVGCGETVDVPLDLSRAPSLTDVLAERSGDDMVVSWTRNEASAVLVGYAGGFGMTYCNEATGSQRTLPGRASFDGKLEVRGLSPVQTTETALGPVRVYYSDLTTIPLPLPVP